MRKGPRIPRFLDKAPDKAQRNALEGVVSLLDALQDKAAKSLGEEAVFGRYNEETGEFEE